jgi:hypothetical protein
VGDSPIGASTGQHLVDPYDVEWMDPDSQVERILAAGLRDVFVGADAGRFERFAGELFVFV